MQVAAARIKRRRPGAAFWLSFLEPGLGHIYCGKFGKGIVLLFVCTAFGAFGSFALFPLSGWAWSAVLAALLVSALIWLYGMFDARRTARKASSDYVLKDYNRWYVYLLLALLEVPTALALASYARANMLKAMYMASSNMYPTIRPGERFLVNKLAYRSEPLRRGDIIAFPNPNTRHVKYVQRVAALPGDSVEIRGAELYINGSKLLRRKVSDSDVANDKARGGQVFEEANGTARYQVLLAAGEEVSGGPDLPKMIVPNGHCFVLGDNRNRAQDSRSFGPVPLLGIVGRVDYVYYPRWVKLKRQGHE